MRYRTVIAGGIGILALGLGVTYTFAPETATQIPGLAVIRDAFRDINPSYLLTGLGAVLSLYAVAATWLGGGTDAPATDSESRYANTQQQPPERVIDDDRTPISATIDADFNANELTKHATADAHSLLHETAHATLTVTTNNPDHALATGSWTDNQLAAAFLSPTDETEYTMWSRLRFWLDPHRERARRVRATAREVDALTNTLSEADSR